MKASFFSVLILALVLFLNAIPQRFTQLSNLSIPRTEAHQVLGLTDQSAALWYLFWEVAPALTSISAAVFMFSRKSNSGMAVICAMTLVTTGISNPPSLQALEKQPDWQLLVYFFQSLNFQLFLFFLFIFPTGEFVPKWTKYVSIGLIIWGALTIAIPDSPFHGHNWPAPVWYIVLVAFLLLGASTQLYRFRYVSSASQRKQTKWIVYGYTLSLLNSAFAIPVLFLPPFNAAGPSQDLYIFILYPVFYAFVPALLPITFVISILWYKLLDIDVVINRTVVFGTLTAMVVATYVGLVSLLDAVFRTTLNWWISIIATSVVALLIQPLQTMLQRSVNKLIYGERDEPYKILSRLSSSIKDISEQESLLDTVVMTIIHALKLPYAAIAMSTSVAPNENTNIVASAGVKATPTIEWPIAYKGSVLGKLIVSPQSDGLTITEHRLLSEIAHQISLVLYSQRLNDEIRRSRERLVNSREEERLRLRRDIHDGLGPTLANITLQLETARDLLSQNPVRAHELLDELAMDARQSVNDIKQIVYGLRPPVLDELGLLVALHSLSERVRQAGLNLKFNLPENLPHLPAALEVAIYRVCQEALTNIVKHAQAHHVSIALSYSETELNLEITDDGLGLPISRPTGVGLNSMRERAEELGGEINFDAPENGGTRIRVCWPLRL